jgi:hypothetical protein
MDFHTDFADRIRASIFKKMISEGLVKDDVSLETLMEKIPYEIEVENVNPVIVPNEEEFTDNISESNEDTVESNEDTVESNEDTADVESPKEKKKKEKKEKKERAPRPMSSYMFFKGHPDNKDAIETAAEEIDEGSGKPVGKVKAAGNVWAKVSDEEKEEWKKRAIEDFESKQSSD